MILDVSKYGIIFLDNSIFVSLSEEAIMEPSNFQFGSSHWFVGSVRSAAIAAAGISGRKLFSTTVPSQN